MAVVVSRSVAVLIISIIAVGAAEIPDELGSKCTTPHKKPGTCREIKQCRDILNLIVTKSEEAIDYAKQSHCGFTVSEPLVCCAEDVYIAPIFQHKLLPQSPQCGLEHIFEKPTTTTTTKSSVEEDDGWSYFAVYGGTKTLINKHPWMALLKYLEEGDTKYLCAGTLISKRYVLTAAHCTKFSPNIDRKLIAARLGEHTISSPNDCEDVFNQTVCTDPVMDVGVEKVTNHPNFKSRLHIHDISLIRLERNVIFSIYIRPICLPLASSLLPVETDLTVVGWGETESKSKSDTKLFGVLPVFSPTSCGIKLDTKIGKEQFCAGGVENEDSCKGDSGGPALRKGTEHDTNQWVQEGIVSFGLNECGINGKPGVYTRVSKYVNWIVDNMAE